MSQALRRRLTHRCSSSPTKERPEVPEVGWQVRDRPPALSGPATVLAVVHGPRGARGEVSPFQKWVHHQYPPLDERNQICLTPSGGWPQA
jgi:hypothetical protein